MRPGTRSALRRRITAALTLMAALASLLVCAALWVGDQWLEDAAVRDLMSRELQRLQQAEAADATPQPLQLYGAGHTPPPPAAFAALPPGFHDEVPHAGREYHVMVSGATDGRRLWLAYDVGFVEAREHLLVLVALAIVASVIGLALVLARRTATRTLAPLERLVGGLRALDPERRGERLDEAIEDDELRAIAQAVNRYVDRLNALVERERAFAAAASHELRTPLAVLRGGIETLQLGGAQPALARMQRAAIHATEQLDALLALSRVRESPPAQPLALERLLPELAEPYLTPEVRLHWDLQPVTLEAPPGAVAIVFTNLLRNALRAARGGEVFVSLRAGEVSVADSGPGVAAADLAQVFEPHFRGADGGSGMGLYIARTLAQRLGWSLALDNRPGGGAIARWRFGGAAQTGAEGEPTGGSPGSER